MNRHREGRTWLYGLVGVLCWMLAWPVTAQEPWSGTATAGFEVKTRRKQVLGDAEVEMRFAEIEPIAGPPPRRTGPDGKVSFQGLAEGRWRVDVRRDGYSSYLMVVRVVRGAKAIIVSGPIRDATGAPMRLGVINVKPVARPAEARPAEVRPAPRPQPVTPRPAVEPTPAPSKPAAPQVTEPTPAPAAAPDPPPEKTPEASAPSPVAAEPATPEPSAPQPATPQPATPQPAAPRPEPTPAVPEPSAPQPEPVQPDPTPAVPEPSPQPSAPQPSAPQPATPEPAATSPDPEPAVTPNIQQDPAEVPSPPAPAPTVAEPTPPAVAPAPSPARVRSSSVMRSAASGTCAECKRGEWALSVEQAVPAGSGDCPDDLEERMERAAEMVSSSSSAASYAGPLVGGGEASLRQAAGDALARQVLETVAPVMSSAGCQAVAVVLPRGARYTGYLYEVADAFGTDSCLAGQDCSLGDSRWPDHPVIEKGPGATVLWAVVTNTSPSRERRARLTVYFSR